MKHLFQDANSSKTLREFKDDGCTFSVVTKKDYKVLFIKDKNGRELLATTVNGFEGDIGLDTRAFVGENSKNEPRVYLTNNVIEREELELV